MGERVRGDKKGGWKRKWEGIKGGWSERGLRERIKQRIEEKVRGDKEEHGRENKRDKRGSWKRELGDEEDERESERG